MLKPYRTHLKLMHEKYSLKSIFFGIQVAFHLRLFLCYFKLPSQNTFDFTLEKF